MSTYIKQRAADLGIPIVDATDPVTFEVTPKQIAKSKIRDNTACALVRACEENVPRIQAAFFFRSVAYLEYKTKMVRFKLPEYVQREIVVFDRSGLMAAGVYKLRPPAKAERLDTKRGKARKPNQGKLKMPKRVLHRMPGVRNAQDPTLRAKQEG